MPVSNFIFTLVMSMKKAIAYAEMCRVVDLSLPKHFALSDSSIKIELEYYALLMRVFCFFFLNKKL